MVIQYGLPCPVANLERVPATADRGPILKLPCAAANPVRARADIGRGALFSTYYFESVEADLFREFGFSKDHRVGEVQVVMGLLTDSDGIPMGYELFPGNTLEFKTLLSSLNKLRKLYKIDKVIVAADRGLNSKSNLASVKEPGSGGCGQKAGQYYAAIKCNSLKSLGLK